MYFFLNLIYHNLIKTNLKERPKEVVGGKFESFQQISWFDHRGYNAEFIDPKGKSK